MPIETTNPISVPAKTYATVGVAQLHIEWPDFNQPVQASYILKIYRTDDSGVVEMSPSPQIKSQIDDLYALAGTRAAANKPALANALAAVLAALQEIEHEKGTI